VTYLGAYDNIFAMSDCLKPYVFIDESGDAGFKTTSGSSSLFCIAAVVFRSHEAMDEVEKIMRQLRADFHFHPLHEFHFNKESCEKRAAFCQAISDCDFSIRAIVVDKEHIYENSALRKSPRHFYNYITSMLLEYNFDSIQNANVRIDGRINCELRTYLRKQLNSQEKIISSVEFADSRKTQLIQLADMVAGGIARSFYPHKREHKVCLRTLRPRIEEIWEFGKRSKFQVKSSAWFLSRQHRAHKPYGGYSVPGHFHYYNNAT